MQPSQAAEELSEIRLRVGAMCREAAMICAAELCSATSAQTAAATAYKPQIPELR